MIENVKTARTGLKMDMALYRAAQMQAAKTGQSFAAYVTDLVALDIAEHGGADAYKITDVRRVLGLGSKIKPNPALRDLQRRERAEAISLAAEIHPYAAADQADFGKGEKE